MNQLRLFILIMIMAGSTHCKRYQASSKQIDSNNVKLIDSMPFIEFENPITSVGKILSGEKVGMDFVFYNKGRQSLIIRNAKATCGCTVPLWDEKPVQPGAKGIVHVIYDSGGELGMQNKSIRIISNARNNETDLIISAEVVN
jgi:hypothetical protein